jgi:hypothetical protein
MPYRLQTNGSIATRVWLLELPTSDTSGPPPVAHYLAVAVHPTHDNWPPCRRSAEWRGGVTAVSVSRHAHRKQSDLAACINCRARHMLAERRKQTSSNSSQSTMLPWLQQGLRLLLGFGLGDGADVSGVPASRSFAWHAMTEWPL